MKHFYIIISLSILSWNNQQTSLDSNFTQDLNILFNKIHDMHPNSTMKYSYEEWMRYKDSILTLNFKSDAEKSLVFMEMLAKVGEGHTEAARTPESLRGLWLPLLFHLLCGPLLCFPF